MDLDKQDESFYLIFNDMIYTSSWCMEKLAQVLWLDSIDSNINLSLLSNK